MALTKTQKRDLFRTRAANYGFTANLYYFIGFREVKCGKSGVSALGLNPGDMAVEIGRRTGLNLPYLLESIGETVRLIGVDFTDAMLEKAREKIHHHEWQNV